MFEAQQFFQKMSYTPIAGIIRWDPFWGESNLILNVAGNFEGFPLVRCLGWLGCWVDPAYLTFVDIWETKPWIVFFLECWTSFCFLCLGGVKYLFVVCNLQRIAHLDQFVFIWTILAIYSKKAKNIRWRSPPASLTTMTRRISYDAIFLIDFSGWDPGRRCPERGETVFRWWVTTIRHGERKNLSKKSTAWKHGSIGFFFAHQKKQLSCRMKLIWVKQVSGGEDERTELHSLKHVGKLENCRSLFWLLTSRNWIIFGENFQVPWEFPIQIYGRLREDELTLHFVFRALSGLRVTFGGHQNSHRKLVSPRGFRPGPFMTFRDH